MKYLLVLIVTLISGCASIEPKAPDSSALIGFVSVELDSKWRLFLPGIQKSPIEIKIENLDSGKAYTVKSDSKGFFFLPNINPGLYALSQWRIERSTSSENWYLRGDVTDNVLEVLPGTIAIFKATRGNVTVISEPNNKFNFNVDFDVTDMATIKNILELKYPEWISYLN